MSEKNPDGFMGSPDGEIEAAAVAAGVPSICPAINDGADTEGEQDAFADNAEDVATEETRRKIELFAWADGALGLSEAELELELEDAVKHFNLTRGALKQIIKARRADKSKAEAKRSAAAPSLTTVRTTSNTTPPTSRFQIAAYLLGSSMIMDAHFGRRFAGRGSTLKLLPGMRAATTGVLISLLRTATGGRESSQSLMP